MRKSIQPLLISILTAGVHGQTMVDLSRQGKLGAGTGLPQHCAVGQAFLKTDAPSGSNLYTCTATDTWTAIGVPVFGGDVSGTPTAAKVKAIQGLPVSTQSPSDQNVLRWNASTGQWEPGAAANALTAGNGIAIAGNSITVEDAIIPQYFAGLGTPSVDCTAGRDFYIDASSGNLYFCKAQGQWQQLSAAGHTHTAGDITAGTLASTVLPPGLVWSGQANTYIAGQRQSVAHDGTAAGFRLVPGPGDPAQAQDGDIWYNATAGKFRRRQNGIITDWDTMSGNAATATALAATPSQCGSGQYATGVAATGNANCATVTYTQLGGRPAIPTIGSTNLLLKGDGSGNAMAAAPGTDYQAPPAVSPTSGATPVCDLGIAGNVARCEHTLSVNVTASFAHLKAGAKFSWAWTQNATGGFTVAYTGASNTCPVNPAPNSVTVQQFEVAADGVTIAGVGCSRSPALTTGSGSYAVTSSSVPPDGCATYASGNLGSTGSPCGTGGGGSGTVDADSVSSAIYCSDSSGTVNSIVCSTGAAFPAVYNAGQSLVVRVANTNTGPVAINVAGLGARAVTKNGRTALAAGDLTSGGIYFLTYDGSGFVVQLGPPAHGPAHSLGGSDPVSLDASQIASGTISPARSAAITGDISKAAGSGAAAVTAIQGRALASSAPADQQVLQWSAANSQWQPGTVSGSGGVGMSPGNGYIEVFPAELTQGQTYAANAGYFFQFVLRDTIPLNAISIILSTASTSSHFATALMDANCAKIVGSDSNVTNISSVATTVTLVPSTHPLALTPGIYYFAAAADASFTVQGGSFFNSAYYAAPGQPRFFTGNVPSGNGGTLAVAGTCGTRTKIVDNFRPLIYLYP